MVGGKPLVLAGLEHALEHDEPVRAHLHPAVCRDVELHGQPIVRRAGEVDAAAATTPGVADAAGGGLGRGVAGGGGR